MFIDLNYISVSFSALHLAHPLSHPIMASFYISSSFKTTALSTLCVIIALLCSEILGYFYESLNKRAHRKSCHLSGKGLTFCSATRKGVIPVKQTNQPKTYLSRVPVFCHFKIFPSSSPKGRTFKSIGWVRTAVSALSLITLYCPLYELQWHIIILTAI